MLRGRGFILYLSVAISLVILGSVYTHSVHQAKGMFASAQEIPVVQAILPEDLQGTIKYLCEENDLSYALVLAVYQAEGNDNIMIDRVKSDIEKLAYYRNYWADQGYADEFVFDLMLMSNHYGLETCEKQIEDDVLADPDSYVQHIADFKYHFEQSQGVQY